jgi:hypothetical protein
MNNRIIDILVLLLVAVGLAAFLQLVIASTGGDFLRATSRILQYAALPVGILLRTVKWLNSEKEKLDKLLNDVRSTALENRASDSILKEQFQILREDLISWRGESFERHQDLDKRLIVFEARSGLNNRLEQVELRLIELGDRFNQSLVERDQNG